MMISLLLTLLLIYRVAIARALLKNPRVLILDEATSALDAESEYLVQDALDRISRNRTVITIAHRASTLQRSDLVLCLDGGQAVEMGSYTELMAARGTFWRIMERQRTATIDKDNEGENDDNHDNNDSDGDDDAIKSDIFGQQTEQLLSRKR
jgi:ABC-type multidrug transport system ATPase subunit